MAKRYTVNDGKLVLTLEPIGKGIYMVRSPMDAEIVTSAKTISEAYSKAYDVQKGLRASRRKWASRRRLAAAG